MIDPRTFRIVRHFAVGGLPQHVVPAWDLRRLYVTNDAGNSLTPIDPRTGEPGARIPVEDPYNMYFSPDGRYAIVVAERLHRLDFRDPHTFALRHSLAVPCLGVDHMDFSADRRYLLASCEFSGQLVVVSVRRQRVLRTLDLPDGPSGMPQDVKLSPDGRIFYVADMHASGVWEIDARRFRVRGFLRTGAGTHGLYPSRDAKLLYVSNRSAGTVSVVSFRSRRVVATWRIPAAAPTWAASPPTVGSSGCPAVTTARSTQSRHAPDGCSRASPSAQARTASASGRSPGASHSATPVSSVETTRSSLRAGP